MQKTEGYFNDIAWGNYVKECSWLVHEDGVESSAEAVKAGVHVRPVMDIGLGDTMRWAVDVILGELENKVRVPNPTHVQYASGYGNKEVKYGDDDEED